MKIVHFYLILERILLNTMAEDRYSIFKKVLGMNKETPTITVTPYWNTNNTWDDNIELIYFWDDHQGDLDN